MFTKTREEKVLKFEKHWEQFKARITRRIRDNKTGKWRSNECSNEEGKR